MQVSTSGEYLKEHHIDVTEFPQAEDTFRAFLQGQVDVVVYDAPVLLHYASHEGNGKVRPVGSIFRTEDYGIVFPMDTRYRKRVNMALLKIKEAGVYDRLYRKWFGASGS